MFSSFVCERSVEYVVCGNIVAKLDPSFGKILPFYFWSNREGGVAASRAMENISGRLISIFARRPKIEKGEGRFFMKINEPVMEYARESSRQGIPVFFGMPDIISLRHFAWGCECIWYDSVSLGLDGDIFINVSSGEVCDFTLTPKQRSVGRLSSSDIISVIDQSPLLFWGEAVARLREFRKSLRGDIRFGYPYKPFHLFLMSESVLESLIP